MTTGVLQGLVVVELTSSVPGEFCGRLLSDAGADVIKLEGPEGSALRRWSASGSPIDPTDDSALFQYLGSSKQSVVIDPVSAGASSDVLSIVKQADAVVWSRDWELASRDGLSAEALSRAAPGAVVTAITPFGLTGPWAQAPATDFTLQHRRVDLDLGSAAVRRCGRWAVMGGRSARRQATHAARANRHTAARRSRLVGGARAPRTGRTLHGGFPVKFGTGPHVWHRTPPPTLGQHNHEILTEWLGLSDRDVADLAARDVIGDRPGSTTRML